MFLDALKLTFHIMVKIYSKKGRIRASEGLYVVLVKMLEVAGKIKWKGEELSMPHPELCRGRME